MDTHRCKCEDCKREMQRVIVEDEIVGFNCKPCDNFYSIEDF